MPESPPNHSKLRRPQATGLLSRPRLFEKLDGLCNHGAGWIYAPAGAGKTSLITSWLETHPKTPLWYRVDEDDSDVATLVHYLNQLALSHSPNSSGLPVLTPEYLTGFSTFARKFARDFIHLIPSPFVLILDDIHLLDSKSLSYSLLEILIKEFAAPNAMILCGRVAPPDYFARLEIDETTLSWKDLQFNQHETEAIINSINPAKKGNVAEIREISQGWIAGIRLLAGSSMDIDKIEIQLDPQANRTLFAYFSHELFATRSEFLRNFLISIAPLESLTAEQAHALSGQVDAENLLESLWQEQFFLTRLATHPPYYRFHPLFSSFLKEQAQRLLPPQSWLQLRKQAARLADNNGEYEVAAWLYVETQSWPELTGLVCTIGDGFVIQGRHQLIDDWLSKVPEKILKQSRWLLYWLGTARFYDGELRNSRSFLEQAFDQFEQAGEQENALMTWGGIIDSFNYEWDDMTPVIGWLYRIEPLFPADPLLLPDKVLARLLNAAMTLEVTHRTHPVNLKLVDCARTVLTRSNFILSQGPASACLLTNCLFSGDFYEAEHLFNNVTHSLKFSKWPVMAQLLFKIMGCICAWQQVNTQLAYQRVDATLDLAERTGVLVTNFMTLYEAVYTALTVGDIEKAKFHHHKMGEMLNHDCQCDQAHYLILSGCIHLLEGFKDEAYNESKHAVTIAESFNSEFLALIARAVFAWCLIVRSEYAHAKAFIQETLARTITYQTKSIEFECRVALAYNELTNGNLDLARQELKSAFELGRRKQYFVTGPAWFPEKIALLCAEALSAGIETDYVRALIARRSLLPPAPDVINWPWPVRIVTLGRFNVLVNDAPLQFSFKSPGKPLQLLQVIITNGGSNVAVDSILDTMWPESDGDVALNAFNVTLSRLRKLLGESAIILSEHKISVNDLYCWVDAWALSRMTAELDNLASIDNVNDDGEIGKLAKNALELYQGPFLKDIQEPYVNVQRAILRSRFLRLTKYCANHLLKRGLLDEAIAFCQKVLEAEPFNEELLMVLIQALCADKRNAQAITVIQEAKAFNQKTLGIPLSPKLQEMLQSLIS